MEIGCFDKEDTVLWFVLFEDLFTPFLYVVEKTHFIIFSAQLSLILSHLLISNAQALNHIE
jgi:hypothetical protein